MTSFVDDMLKLVNVIESCICGDKSVSYISIFDLIFDILLGLFGSN